jgi:hypothetical protein
MGNKHYNTPALLDSTQILMGNTINAQNFFSLEMFTYIMPDIDPVSDSYRRPLTAMDISGFLTGL